MRTSIRYYCIFACIIKILQCTSSIKFSAFSGTETDTVILQKNTKRQIENSSEQQNKLTIKLINNHVQFKLPLIVADIQYNLTIDTGSSAFFIKGEQSSGNPKTKYQSNVEYMKQFKLHQLSYMDGTVHLYESTLPVSFGQYRLPSIPVLVAYQSPRYFEQQDGLIGLSYPHKGMESYSFLQNLLKMGVISKQIFGLNINMADNQRSFITLGGGNPNFYQGKLNQYKFIKGTEFKIQIKGISLQQTRIMNFRQALLDTGTTCITFPLHEQPYLTRLFSQHGNRCAWLQQGDSHYFMLMCRISDFTVLPTVNIYIGNQRYSIEKQYYLHYCIAHLEFYFCDTYIEVGPSPMKFVILGDAFFNRYYTVFDLEQSSVSIAKNRENITLNDLFTLKNKYTQFDAEDWGPLIENIKIW